MISWEEWGVKFYCRDLFDLSRFIYLTSDNKNCHLKPAPTILEIHVPFQPDNRYYLPPFKSFSPLTPERKHKANLVWFGFDAIAPLVYFPRNNPYASSLQFSV